MRRMAGRQGLTLRKSRRRDPLAVDFALFWLVEAESGTPVSYGSGRDGGMTADETEEWLRAGRRLQRMDS